MKKDVKSDAIAQPDNFDYNLEMAYSLDFRRKILSVRKKEGLTIAAAKKRFCIPNFLGL
jgi:hypothetical protein